MSPWRRGQCREPGCTTPAGYVVLDDKGMEKAVCLGHRWAMMRERVRTIMADRPESKVSIDKS